MWIYCKSYINRWGKLKVMNNLGDVWKACYNKPYRNIWQEVDVLPWRESREDAERDLEAYAASHGMKKVES